MDFTAILNTVVEAVKGVDWEKVIATVKDIVEKIIPIITDKVVPVIVDLVGKIA
ncbi:MAG: hypothetical protein J6R20_06085 [Clostridia bacterium]|nr:hypothetical protein [Clostridia bacterium]